MDGVAYCKRNGIRNTKKIKKWVDAGYLGDASKDEKTGKYIISKDVPVPFSANAKVSTFPTLMRDILTAATKGCSIFSSMYPNIKPESFERVLQDCVDANLVRICHTECGNPFLEITTEGARFLSDYTEKERKLLFDKAYKLILTGISLFNALVQLGVFS